MLVYALFIILNFYNFISIRFEKVERSIYLNSHKIRTNYKIKILNDENVIINSFKFIFDKVISSKIYYVEALYNDNLLNIQLYNSDESTKYDIYDINFNIPLQKNMTIIIHINMISSCRFKPFPEYVPQNTPQYFIFEDNIYIDSLYAIQSQQTTVYLDKSKIVSTTKHPSITTSRDSIQISNIQNSVPFSYEYFYVHFSYTSPILIIDKMLTTYQISEWGYIKVLHEFWIHNDVASLKNGYSRFKDSHNRDPHTVYEWKMQIPSNSYNILYRDDLGNISTSSIYHYALTKYLTLEPRFPIFGGWQTYYYVSYIMTPYNFLYINQDNKQRIIKFNLLGNPMDNYLISHAQIKVILPESSFNYKIQNKNKFNINYSTEYLYLDFIGRNAISFELSNACAEKDMEVEIIYENKSLFYKLFIVIFTLLVIMISIQVIILNINYSISTTSNINSRDDIKYLVQDIYRYHDELANNYKKYMETLNAYKQNKDYNNYKNSISNIDKYIDQHTHKIKQILDHIHKFDSNILGNASLDFEIKNNQHKDILSQYEDITIQVINGKLNRNEYIKLSKPLEEQFIQANSTLKSIIYSI